MAPPSEWRRQGRGTSSIAGRIDFYGVLSMLPVVRPVEYSRGFFYAQGGERVQIPKGRAYYVIFLYQAYHLLKKIKSAQMSTCRHFSNLSCFSAKQKTRQTSRQTVSRFGFFWDTLICSNVDMSTFFKSVVCSRQTKNSTDEQTDSQQIWFSGTLYWNLSRYAFARNIALLCAKLSPR
jgi:hypothetical protein